METMDTNLAQPYEGSVCSEDSRDSHVRPSNFDVVATHDANCKDEILEAPETNAMKSMMEQQSNNGDGNDGDRFINSSVGKKESFMSNSHVRDTD